MNLKKMGVVFFMCFILFFCGCDSGVAGEGAAAARMTIIKNCNDLQNIKNDLAGNYYLSNNIDCSSTKTWNHGTGFEPIGQWFSNKESENIKNIKFSGTFNGNNKKITGLFINRPDWHTGTGLFGLSEGATISRVTLENVDISGGKLTGALVGSAYKTTVANVAVSGVVRGLSSVGGVAGLASGKPLTAINSNAKVFCSSGKNEFIGGAVGILTADLSYSSAVGDVTCENGRFVGGLVGYSMSGRVYNSFASGTVQGKKDVGGLEGGHSFYSMKSAELADSYAKGRVIGVENVGGLLGNAYSVNGNSIENCYSSGKVEGTLNKGGLIGKFDTVPLPGSKLVFVKNCFWNKETSASDQMCGSQTGGMRGMPCFNDNGKNYGKTTVEMKQQSTFTGWDFKKNWAVPAGSYPSLR